MSTTRRRLLDNTFKKTVVGNPAVATDSLARMYPGIEMQGWTEQDSTTGAQLFDTSGLELDYTLQYIHVNVGDGEFTLSTDYIVTDRSDIFFLSGNVNSGASSANNGVELGNNRTITSENGYVTVVLRRNSDGINNPLDYHIMLNEGSTALPWEPYTGGAPSPSPDYPQEIVSSGSWDETAQKWEYEIEVSGNDGSSQTVLLTSDRPLTKWDKLEKRNGQWGWVYGSAEIVLDGSEDEAFSIYETPREGKSFSVTLNDSVGGYQTSLCDKYRNINESWSSAHKDEYAIYSDHMKVTNKARYFRPPSAAVETLEQWKAWLSENPLTLWFETEVETFVPLTASEQERMNTLYTYRPTTVLTNQQDCEMALTYKTRKSMEVTA